MKYSHINIGENWHIVNIYMQSVRIRVAFLRDSTERGLLHVDATREGHLRNRRAFTWMEAVQVVD